MFDSFILGFDKALRTVLGEAATVREAPGRSCPDAVFPDEERRHSGALMRINHVGEVCAQALYQGQALACRNPTLRGALAKAAGEETEHLAWTERRINELGAHKSLLNPFWYAGAFAMGFAAGKLGDDWSLGFLAETERQVGNHLAHHLFELPAEDLRSRAIVRQMQADEMAHAEMAVRLGARELPDLAKATMRKAARVMTFTAYYI